jgi:hypothetical protein
MNVVKQHQEQIKNVKQAAKSLAQALLLSADTCDDKVAKQPAASSSGTKH